MNKKDLTESKFKNGYLEDLSLEQLAEVQTELDLRYGTVKAQYRMMTGLVLLEARDRFPSNQEFGHWITENLRVPSFGKLDPSRLSETMNFARFFKDRDYSKIPLTGCYRIAEPKHAAYAEEVYDALVSQPEKVTLNNVDGTLSLFRNQVEQLHEGENVNDKAPEPSRNAQKEPGPRKQLPPSKPREKSQFELIREALEGLGIDPLTEETLLIIFKGYAQKHHPDKGGDSEKFQQIKQWVEILEETAE